MDDQQFDTMARALASGITRRGALGILAGLAGLEWAEDADAKRRHKGAARNKNRKRGSAAKRRQRQRAAVAAQKKDKVGVCHRTGSEKNPLVFIEVDASAVPAHEAHGDDVNVDLQTDPENCGTCGNVCAGDACNTPVCEGGECGTEPVVCDDDDACTEDTCDVAQGGCVFTPISCDDGDACTEDSCDPDSGCVHTPTDCDDGDVCTKDSCDPAVGCRHTPVECGSDETCCPGTGCTNLASDEANCGACGRACNDGETCCEGICTTGGCAGICNQPIECNVSAQDCGLAGLGCLCGSTTEGGFGCGDPACTDVSCGSSTQCVSLFGAGAFCETASCCGVNECVMPCVPGTTSAATAKGQRMRGSSGS